jgi:hypothetical protein
MSQEVLWMLEAKGWARERIKCFKGSPMNAYDLERVGAAQVIKGAGHYYWPRRELVIISRSYY